MVFYVAGHSKNVCDRQFNLLKEDLRVTNQYGFDDIVLCMNGREDIDAIAFDPTTFLDRDTYLN